jgi:hypothetical protein
MSATCPRNSRRGRLPAPLFLFPALFLAAALLAGCAGAGPAVLDRAREDLLAAKADRLLAAEVRKGERDAFAVIAVFRKDVFLGQSSMLERSSIPILDELGNAALLLVRPGEVLPLLSDPSVAKATWFGPQGRLARLDPSLELELLDRFGKGTEGKERLILARYRSVPEAKEVKAAESAGFKVVSRTGPNLVLSGPMSGIPGLLNDEWIIYLEKGFLP